MPSKPEEEFCKGAFQNHLQDQHGVRDADWVPEPNGATTPPDYRLSYGGKSFSVEITALMPKHDQISSNPVPELGIWKKTESFAAEIQQEAIDSGLLRGTYVLTLVGPYDSFRQSLNQLRQHLKKFIEMTRDSDQVPWEKNPFEASGQRYFIQKYCDEGNQIAIATMGNGDKWGWSVEEELRSLAEEAITTKASKLRNVPQPWILLLLDCYHNATAIDCERVGAHLFTTDGNANILRQFHSIYIIDPHRHVFPLLAPRGEGLELGE